MIDLITQTEMDLIKGVLTIVFGGGIGSLSVYLNKILKSKKFLQDAEKAKVEIEKGVALVNAHKQLALEACKFAQMAFSDFGGERKLAEAESWFTKEVKSKFGVNLDSATVQGYIHSGLKTLKNDFKDEWSEIPTTYSAEKPIIPQSAVSNTFASQNL